MKKMQKKKNRNVYQKRLRQTEKCFRIEVNKIRIIWYCLLEGMSVFLPVIFLTFFFCLVLIPQFESPTSLCSEMTMT